MQGYAPCIAYVFLDGANIAQSLRMKGNLGGIGGNCNGLHELLYFMLH